MSVRPENLRGVHNQHLSEEATSIGERGVTKEEKSEAMEGAQGNDTADAARVGDERARDGEKKSGMKEHHSEVASGPKRTRKRGEAERLSTERHFSKSHRYGGRVLCFWGHAGWLRAHLLGQIASGLWGVCRGGVFDIVNTSTERWDAMDGRLAFAPVSDMTEKGILEAKKREEEATRKDEEGVEQNGGDSGAEGEGHRGNEGGDVERGAKGKSGREREKEESSEHMELERGN